MQRALTAEHLAVDDHTVDPICASELKEIIDKLVSTLTYRQQKVIRLRYGIGGSSHNLREIGEMFRLSKETVRIIEAKAIRSLQHPMRRNRLFSFIPPNWK
jgi:RNA polymerase primary sigma factor